jgi:hypothetical protein
MLLWSNNLMAMPKNYYKLLKGFEVGGFQALNLRVFLVDSIYTLIHLNPHQARVN